MTIPNCLRYLVFILTWLGAIFAPGPAGAAPLPGDTLPAFSLQTAGGDMQPAWRPGEVTVLSFCAFWCDTWKEQSRRLEALKSSLHGLPVHFTIVAVDGRWADKGQSGTWSPTAQQALLDWGGTNTQGLGVHAVPYTLVVDGKGQVRYASQGIGRAEYLLPFVQGALSGRPLMGGPVHLVFDSFPSNDPALDKQLLQALKINGLQARLCGTGKAPDDAYALAQAGGQTLGGSFVAPKDTLVDPFDYQRPGQEELLRRIVGQLQPGSTILLHAGVGESVDALPRLAQVLRQGGYEVGP